MSRNGSGTYARAVSAYVYGTIISQTDVNSEFDDIATALTASLAKDGQTAPTANLPMATYRHTGVGNASARTDYAAAGQVQDGKLNWADGGGTADAITATYSPAITALVDGQLCCVRATAANATTTPTFAPNGLTARTIVRRGGGALVAGSIAADGHELILRYDLANTRWEFINSQSVIGADVQAYDVDTAKLDVDQAWTGAQRGTITTDNDLSFDLNVTNNFLCTPTAGGTLTFTNHTSGQSGFIKLVNGSNYAIAAAATTKISTADLTKISATGTYLLSYFDDGTNTYVVASANLA